MLKYRKWEEGKGHFPYSLSVFAGKPIGGHVSCFCISVPVSNLQLPENQEAVVSSAA